MSYLDSFDPISIRQDASGGRISMLSGGGTRQYGSDTTRPRKLAQHYTYWNYVSITRTCEFLGGQFPQVGIPVKGSSARHLTAVQRQHLKAYYSRAFAQSVYDDLEPIPLSHPFLELLTHVNGEDTWEDFAFEVFLFWQLTGTVYIWAIPSGLGLPAELWVIPTHWVNERRDKKGRLVEYEVIPEGDRGRKETIPEEEVFKGILKSPKSKVEGYSPLEAAPLWTDQVEWIENSRGQHFRNGRNPDVLLKLGDKHQDPAEDTITRIKEKFQRRTAGVEKHGETVVVPPGIDIEKWSQTPKEMDYTNSGDSARRSNLALHGTPPIVAGISDDYTRATAEAGLLVMSQWVINPKLRRFAGLLNKIAGRFDPRLVVWFEDTAPDDKEFILQQERADFEMGAIDPDEIRTSRGREAKGEPTYESGYIGGGKLPLSEAAAPEPEPPDDLPEDETEDDPPEEEEQEDDDE